MSGFGIQKRGTGKAVKKMSLGGALAIKSGAYQGKPGTYEQSYYTQALFPQATQVGYVPPPESKKEEEEEKKPIFLQVAIPTIKEDWKKLFEVANEWTKKEVNNAEAWFELGFANENLNNLNAAEKAYRQSIKLDHQNTDALLRLGFIAKSKEDKIEIKNIQEQIAKINPDLLEDYYKLVGCSKTCD